MTDRDRDENGRARNARPRDRLGRPLPRDVAGAGPDPHLKQLETAPPDVALAGVQQLLERGRPFEAHEVLEAAWKRAPDSERPLWQALAQLAVALTHQARGNVRGAQALFERSAAELDRWPERGPYGLDIAGLREAARRLAAGAADVSVRLTR